MGFILWLVLSCINIQAQRLNGISLVASTEILDQPAVDPVLEVGATHVAVMPFGFVRSLSHPEVIYNTSRQWHGETLDGASQYIDVLHNNGLRVMLKPQLWIWRGEFTGHLEMESEAAWKEFETGYRRFILDYAQLAAQKEVALFCIGTELENFIVIRPKYWQQLINEIREIYKGPITYAANWDEYKRVPFWAELDYIGIDAYFPVSELKTPTEQDARAGWDRWKEEMSSVSRLSQRPVLFTEYGYRSMDFAGKEPWLASRGEQKVNLDAQAHLLTALYEELWDEPWFAGGFLWKWFLEHDRSGGPDNDRFTPQNKPATLVVQYYYEKPE